MKQFLSLILLVSIIACNNEKKGYSITGDATNIEDGKMVYISELDSNLQPVKKDSAAIKDGNFTIDLPEVTQSNLSILNIEGINGNVIFISENETIDFKVYKDSLQTSEVTGGKENKLFFSYLDHLKELNKKVMNLRMKGREIMTTSRDTAKLAELGKEEGALKDNDMTFKKKLVQENPNMFVSVLVLTDMANLGAQVGEVNELYESLSNDVKNTPIAKSLKENLDKRNAVEVGSKAPDFTAPNPEGKEISLNESLGKVTLIDFWAAWCKPCRAENPNVVRIYEKYHDKGFNILGVSLDRENQKDKWIQAIADDKLTWNQVSNLKFWQDPIAQLYGVRAIPAQFILDENGVIVARNLRGDELEAKIKELLEK